jgi:eukaryotic-like serine/threonine-protein kinase
MTPERWRQITEVFHAALARDAAERGPLLDEACAGDLALRVEVDAMLAAHGDAGQFGEDPVFTPPDEMPRLEPGASLGPYRIETLIGSGGMGEVYRARDTRLDRDVAIKILPDEVRADAGRRSRFEREARAASALNHPNIITIHDIGEAGGVSYIVMECVQGRTLRDLLAHGPLETQELLQIAAQAAEGLAKAHSAGIVHRDLKPENLMVSADGVVKILDFGLAKQSLAASTRPTPPQTESRTVMGTVGYMSPEQATARPVDFRSDQFSLGSILYELATGKRAFQRASHAETLSALLRDDPEPIERLNPGAPAPLRGIVARCLRKDPEERYASTRDLARELQTLRDRLGETLSAGQSAMRPAPSPRPVWPWLTTVALVALAGLGVWRVRATRSPTSVSTATAAASIAVLPFQNFGGRAEDEYFADGITEAIITELARTNGLTVIARNSTFQYKGKNVDVRRVGEELEVGYILEGSVQRSVDRLRLHAQLIDVSTGTHRWAKRYDREVKDVFAIQDDIAGDIAAALNVALGPTGVPSARSAPTQNMEAYDTYLRGRYWLLKNDEDPRGVEMIERAVALDPAFGSAHSALALAYAGRFWFKQEAAWEEKAAVEVQKALALDPNRSDDAYLARGWLAWNLARGFPHEATIRDVRRALEINPNNGDASFLLGLVYLHVGLLEEGREAFARTLRLNPHKAWHPGTGTGGATNEFMAWAFLLEHRYDRALAEYERNPQMNLPIGPTALLYLGRDREARQWIEEALSRFKQDPDSKYDLDPLLSLRAVLRARAGEHEKAEADIAEAIRLGQGRNHFHHTEYSIASAYAAMGRKKLALEWLEKTVADGFPCYPYFEKDPHLDGLRGEREFQAFMQRLKARWEGYRALL